MLFQNFLINNYNQLTITYYFHWGEEGGCFEVERSMLYKYNLSSDNTLVMHTLFHVLRLIFHLQQGEELSYLDLHYYNVHV